jgi:ornithine carbamoyltransferase
MPVKIMDKRNLLFLHCLPKNGNFEFWPCIIEKAIAKVYGTYQDVCFTADRGVKDLLLLLTGFPVS